MQVSFIVPLYNCLELTKAMLGSLHATLPAGLPHEIILVDDGSTDGTREWLATLGPNHLALANEKNLGYAASNNRGAAVARGDILTLLNNDLILTPGWFEPMAAILERFPKAGVVGNVQLNARTGVVDHCGIYYNARGIPTHDRTQAPKAPCADRPVFAATGACMLVARARFMALNGFDEIYRNGCEDVDLCLRARAAGGQNYVALDSVVHHHVSSSPGRNLHNIRNAYLLMRRWREQIPGLAAESWREPALRDDWEEKLTGWPRLRARLLKPWLRGPNRACPPWIRRATARAVDRQLKSWQRLFPEA